MITLSDFTEKYTVLERNLKNFPHESLLDVVVAHNYTASRLGYISSKEKE